jgi:hypothetical protein
VHLIEQLDDAHDGALAAMICQESSKNSASRPLQPVRNNAHRDHTTLKAPLPALVAVWHRKDKKMRK